MEAADRFDPSRGGWATYATSWIRRRVQELALVLPKQPCQRRQHQPRLAPSQASLDDLLPLPQIQEPVVGAAPQRPLPQARKAVALLVDAHPPAVAERYEMGRAQAQARLEDAQRCQEAGWRVRVRIDPMIPIDGWPAHYDQLAEQVAELVRPEQVTLGSWRPRTRDVLYQQAPPELRSLLEPGPDGRLRLSNRLALYRPTFARLRRGVAQLSLCKEELDVQAQLYEEFGIKEQACNCLGRAVEPVSAQRFPRRLPLLSMGRQDQFVPTPAA
mgnify:CR=1 FL=1